MILENEPIFSPAQMAVLRAVCDTLVPSLVRADDPDGFWARAASDLDVAEQAAAALATQSPAQQAQFRQLLGLLGSPLVGLSVRGCPPKPFMGMTLAERTRLLQGWATHRLGPFRSAFQALKRLATFLFYALAGEGAPNPNWSTLGYPGPLSPPPPAARPLQPLWVTGDTTLFCDTVIVGSGAGGGVVAGELAEAGHEVIVVEKGPYVAEDGFTQREVEMLATLYEAGGALTTTDLGVSVLAGSCLGGGTTVNWAAAFRTPDYVLEEWAREHHLPHLLTPAYQGSFAAMEAATHVDTHESPRNPQNQALWEGAQARGVHVEAIPRNVAGCEPHACGFCGLGCQHGAKQGTLRTFLQRAHDAGARLLVETTVERVLVERGAAVGVLATQRAADGRPHRVTIRATRVVVAAGALHTPALLRRSGLSHAHLGRHLYLHPTVAVGGFYAQRMDPWFGVMMAAMSDEWGQLDGAYGVKIETPPAHPGLFSLALPWQSGEQHKQVMTQAAHAGIFIVLLRDRDGGRVTLDKRGQPRLHYRLSAYDRQHLWRGIAEAARLHAAAGAHTLLFPHQSHPTYLLSGGEAALEQHLAGLPRWGWGRTTSRSSAPTRWAPAAWAATPRATRSAPTARRARCAISSSPTPAPSPPPAASTRCSPSRRWRTTRRRASRRRNRLQIADCRLSDFGLRTQAATACIPPIRSSCQSCSTPAPAAPAPAASRGDTRRSPGDRRAPPAPQAGVPPPPPPHPWFLPILVLPPRAAARCRSPRPAASPPPFIPATARIGWSIGERAMRAAPTVAPSASAGRRTSVSSEPGWSRYSWRR